MEDERVPSVSGGEVGCADPIRTQPGSTEAPKKAPRFGENGASQLMRKGNDRRSPHTHGRQAQCSTDAERVNAAKKKAAHGQAA